MRHVSRGIIAVIASIMVLSLPFIASADTGSGWRRRGTASESKEASSTITTETIKTVQEQLNQLGFDCGTPDGIAGSKTVEAIKKFQENYGFSVNGVIDADLIEQLKEMTDLHSSENSISEDVFSDKSNILNAEKLLGQKVNASGKVTTNDQLVGTLELYGYSGQFKPSADESNTTVILWKFIFDEYGLEEYENVRDGMTSDFGDPDNAGDVGDISIAYWDDTEANIRKALEYKHNESLILHIYYLDHKENSVKTEDSDEAAPTSINNQTTTQSEKAYTHTCEVNGCKNEGTHTITGFSGATEWYCDEHYKEMEDIINMMVEDVAADSNNSYTSPSSSSAIDYDATLEYSSGDVLICSSEDAMDRYMTALLKDNQGTITEMIWNSEIAYTARGTKCNIIKEKLTKAQVKLLDGDYAGNTVWVVIEAVKKK